MTDPAPSGPHLSLLERGEPFVDRFEAAWRGGTPLRIETLLDDALAADRSFLVRVLMEMERELRHTAGESPQADDYRGRFPDYSDVVESVFGGSATTLDFPGPSGASGGCGPFQVGKTVAGYEIVALLGHGGMGVVFLARQTRAGGRTVALKCIRPEFLAHPSAEMRADAVARFQNEVRAASLLQHDHLVTVYDVGEVDGCPFFAMRYVDGGSLAALLRDGPLPEKRAAELLEAVARAVHHINQHGILHRDLKPGNVLLDQSGRPFMADIRMFLGRSAFRNVLQENNEGAGLEIEEGA